MTPHHLIALAKMALAPAPEHAIPSHSIPAATAESLCHRRLATLDGHNLKLTTRGEAILRRALQQDKLC